MLPFFISKNILNAYKNRFQNYDSRKTTQFPIKSGFKIENYSYLYDIYINTNNLPQIPIKLDISNNHTSIGK